MRKLFLAIAFAAFAGLFYNADAQKTKYKSLQFLYCISGSKTVAGIHNREPNADPAHWTNKIDSVTGKFPGLWSGDFLFQQENINKRQMMIAEAVREWNKGALINIMWHACNPAMDEPCGWDDKGVLSKLTGEQWKEITTDGSPLNKRWKARVDEVCFYLKQLQDKGVEVLWRPMHEMNQGAFWWGGRPGQEGTLKLYRMLHDYMTQVKKLTNLVWIWDIQDFGTLAGDAKAYNPGENYYDVAALDVYDDNSGYSQQKYEIMLEACQGKPVAIGECQKFPTSAQLKTQPKWTFFMCWSELEFKANSMEEIKAVHNAPNVLTLDKMPGWR